MLGGFLFSLVLTSSDVHVGVNPFYMAISYLEQLQPSLQVGLYGRGADAFLAPGRGRVWSWHDEQQAAHFVYRMLLLILFSSSLRLDLAGAVPGVVGTLQAAEAIKIATGVGSPLSSRMLHYDALSARFLVVRRHRCFASSGALLCRSFTTVWLLAAQASI